jgi:NADPH:quinone reductase-like Zn-dependent oxidoreductase
MTLMENRDTAVLKRVQYDRYGGPEQMYFGSYVPPPLERNQVRVKVKAAAINPLDWKLRQGAMKLIVGRAFPKGVGSDYAGTVEAVGEDVTNVGLDDEVFGTMDFKNAGAFAETIVVDCEYLAKKPPQLSFGEAACLPIPAATAWVAIIDRAKARSGSHIFINGCSGAVGTLAVQLALARGARVSGSCGTAAMADAKAAGVDPVFNYADRSSYVKAGKFDAIFDTAGTMAVSEGLSMLERDGVFVDINPTPGRFIRGMLSGRYKVAFATMGTKHLAEIARLAGTRVLRSTIGLEKPFSEALSVIADAEAGLRGPGRIVLAL